MAKVMVLLHAGVVGYNLLNGSAQKILDAVLGS
jgi:hypothetical protein